MNTTKTMLLFIFSNLLKFIQIGIAKARLFFLTDFLCVTLIIIFYINCTKFKNKHDKLRENSIKVILQA